MAGSGGRGGDIQLVGHSTLRYDRGRCLRKESEMFDEAIINSYIIPVTLVGHFEQRYFIS